MFTRARSFLCTVLTASKVKQPFTHPGPLGILMERNRFACNAADDSSLKVVHDPDSKEFRIDFSNCRAFLAYEKEGDLIKIMHTNVPKEMEGRGIGKILAKAVLNHIDQHKYRTESYCDYFRYYVETYEPKYLKYFEN